MAMGEETAAISAATTTIGGDGGLIKQSGHIINSKISSNKLSWGRADGRSYLGSLIASTPVVLAPFASTCFFVTLSQYNGSLSEFTAAGFREGFLPLLKEHGPKPCLKASAVYGAYVLLQAVLFLWLPGETNIGQRTPAGHLLKYKTNGTSAWVVTHALYAILAWYGVLDAGFIPRNWSGLVFAMNFTGFLVTSFAFVKAYLFPTHPEDRKFSG